MRLALCCRWFSEEADVAHRDAGYCLTDGVEMGRFGPDHAIDAADDFTRLTLDSIAMFVLRFAPLTGSVAY